MTETHTELALFELLSLECCVDTDGTVRYFNALGEFHRVYGPAIEYTDGTRVWYQHGQLHRLDGPAIEYPDGSREWYQNGQRHREGGPAVIYADGYREWYLKGRELTRAEWQKAVASMERV
jgi:hypothetical protein